MESRCFATNPPGSDEKAPHDLRSAHSRTLGCQNGTFQPPWRCHGNANHPHIPTNKGRPRRLPRTVGISPPAPFEKKLSPFEITPGLNRKCTFLETFAPLPAHAQLSQTRTLEKSVNIPGLRNILEPRPPTQKTLRTPLVRIFPQNRPQIVDIVT